MRISGNCLKDNLYVKNGVVIPETKTLIVDAIVRETGACNVQVIGKTLVLYRPTKERKISLPR
ncbi:RNA-binding protein YhbY [Salmonella enterica subsp. enterica serovar Cerro str. FSL R8-0235]|nr:RNA-binding protein YhbY [Salmonella enterica subsp. enterica serovar Cerro str. FSL R8-0235]